MKSRFPGGLDNKESVRNVEHLGSIPVSGRSPGVSPILFTVLVVSSASHCVHCLQLW